MLQMKCMSDRRTASEASSPLCLTIFVTFRNRQSNDHTHFMQPGVWRWESRQDLSQALRFNSSPLLLVGTNDCNTMDAFVERLCHEGVSMLHLTTSECESVYSCSERPHSKVGWKAGRHIEEFAFWQSFMQWIHGRKYDILILHKSHRVEVGAGSWAYKAQNFDTSGGGVCILHHMCC